MHFHSFILKPLVALLATSETQYFQSFSRKKAAESSIAHCLWLLAYFLLKSLNIASWVCNSCCSLSKMTKLPTPPSLLPACSLDQGLPGCWFFPSLCHTHQSYKNNIPTTTETWPETLSSFQLHLKGQSQVAFPSCQSPQHWIDTLD